MSAVRAPPEDPRGRRWYDGKELIAETESVGLGTAFMVLRGGFLGGAAVALLSGLFMLSRSREPNRAFRRGEDTTAWVQDMLADGPCAWAPGEVQAAVDAILAKGET